MSSVMGSMNQMFAMQHSTGTLDGGPTRSRGGAPGRPRPPPGAMGRRRRPLAECQWRAGGLRPPGRLAHWHASGRGTECPASATGTCHWQPEHSLASAPAARRRHRDLTGSLRLRRQPGGCRSSPAAGSLRHWQPTDCPQPSGWCTVHELLLSALRLAVTPRWVHFKWSRPIT
jgi:hypothetical protein